MTKSLKQYVTLLQFLYHCEVHNNNNNIYELQLGYHPVAVLTLHVSKHENGWNKHEDG